MLPIYKTITLICILLGLAILVLPEPLMKAWISALATSTHSSVPSCLVREWSEETIAEEIKEKVY